jgi:hypothetical protein
MKSNKLLSIILIVLVYVASAGIVYLLFSQTSLGNSTLVSVPAPTKSTDGQLVFDQTLPRTEVCPMNGVKYSKQQKDWWEKHGPLGVMIENHQNARPQSGLTYADTVYEAVAEGGITRFLAIFYCQDAIQVGPVRSARTYFIDFASEYGDFPLYAHVGGANQPGLADAISQLTDYGWTGYNDLNQFSIGFPVFWRDYQRLGHDTDTEHTMYSTTQKLWDYAKTNRKLTNVDENGNAWDKTFQPYDFKDDAAVSQRGKSQSAHLEFWTGDKNYYVDWTYDPKTNLYNRNVGGVPHIDRDNNKQLTAKTIVILSMQESSANDGYENNVHLLYRDKGTGKATILMDGKKITGTWQKSKRAARTIILDSSGTPIEFNRGKIWFEILPLDGVMNIK